MFHMGLFRTISGIKSDIFNFFPLHVFIALSDGVAFGIL